MCAEITHVGEIIPSIETVHRHLLYFLTLCTVKRPVTRSTFVITCTRCLQPILGKVLGAAHVLCAQNQANEQPTYNTHKLLLQNRFAFCPLPARPPIPRPAPAELFGRTLSIDPPTKGQSS